MGSTISLSKTAYKKLVQKAQLVERFRTLLQTEYPFEDYSDERIQEFMLADRISPTLKKSIRQTLRKRG